LERLDEVEAEADLRIGEIDTELEVLRAERAKLQEEADDWRNKLKFSEDGLELGFDDKFPDAPWRTRSDDYEDQIADLDRQIADLEEEKARYEAQRQQAIGQREVLQGNLTDLREARSDLQGHLDYLQRFDGQRPADGVSAKPWSYVDAPVTNAPGERDPRVYKVALDQFAVGTNGRYLKNQQNKSETYCNIFVWDTTRAMGAEIPHWVDGQGNPVPQGQGSELSANGSIRWLESHGSERGWRTVSAQEARSMANQGHPVVATHENPGGIGHVAMVRPSDSDEIRIAQAGWNNFNDGTVQDGFRDRDVVYYAHN
jgi:TolA-binding protein